MLPPESAIEVSRWTALDWSDGTLEIAERRNRVAVRDVIPWGTGFLAVGYAEDWSMDPPARALVWLTDDGLEWRLASDDSATFAAMDACCVMRARDAFIAWTRDRGSFLSSVDGVTWTRTEHTGGGEEFVVAETAEGLFGLAAPFDGRVWTTTHGMLWHARQSTGLDLKGFGRGALGLLATDFGFLLAAEATGSGILDGCGRWANWFSRDSVAWQEFTLIEGPSFMDGARNTGLFIRGHRFVYAVEHPSCGVSFLWQEPPPVWRTDDGVSWEVAERAFPDEGRFDGRFTLDLSRLQDGEIVRLSPDGETILEIEATEPASLYEGWPAAVGPTGIVLFQNNSGPYPAVSFGRAVVDVSPTVKPAVYCGSLDAALCLYLVREVASERTPDGTAFIVSRACVAAWMDCTGSHFSVVAVPPAWPNAGKLKRWQYDDGHLSRGSSAGWAEHITNRLVNVGPWTDALVADQLWLQFKSLDALSTQQVLHDYGLSGPVNVRPVGDVLWFLVGIRGRWPAATKLAALRDDPRICAAGFIRFDPAILKGEGEAALLRPPDDPGCD